MLCTMQAQEMGESLGRRKVSASLCGCLAINNCYLGFSRISTEVMQQSLNLQIFLASRQHAVCDLGNLGVTSCSQRGNCC